MATVVGLRRAGWAVLFFVLVGVIAGCGSDGEVAAPPPAISASSSETSVPFSEVSAPSILDILEVDDSELMPLSIITDSFVPEITADDIMITGGDGGTSYLYVFPTRELSDGVSFDLEARWDSVDDGLQPSLTWNLTGGESSPSDFVFVASLPKSFAETVDDIVFDPQPDEIIDPDPLVEWLVDFLTTGTASFSATSKTTVSSDEAVDVIGSILDQANSVRLHSELSACTKWGHHIPSLATCLLAVVADNPGRFSDPFGGTDRCDDLGLILRGFNPYPGWGPMLSLACQNVVGLARYAAPVDCVAPSDPVTSMGCLKMVWQLLAGACEDLDPLDQQICVYEAVFAVGDQERCASLERLGNPEMANDCRAAITKDPSWCAKTKDPDLRASCCENFRGTDAYETCLGTAGEMSAGQDTTATTADETTDTAADETDSTGATLPPPPIGGDIQSVDTEWFYANYRCTGYDFESTDPEYLFDELHYRYSWADGRMMYQIVEFSDEAFPFEFPYDHGLVAFAMWSPGVWLPLDGSSYLVIEGHSADTNNSPYAVDLETYSDVIFEPASTTTLEEHGWEWNVVRYVGGYAYTRDEVDNDGGPTRTTKERIGHSYNASYHERTGLLLANDFTTERFQYETNYESEPIGHTFVRPLGVISGGECVLVDTNLNLGG